MNFLAFSEETVNFSTNRDMGGRKKRCNPGNFLEWKQKPDI